MSLQSFQWDLCISWTMLIDKTNKINSAQSEVLDG